MDYDLVSNAAATALKSISAGDPIGPSFARIAALVLPKLPDAAAKTVAGLALSDDVEALNEQFRAVLAEEPPSADINGLCFGIAEMVWGEEGDERPRPGAVAEFTLYISGSTEFDPENEDWPCGPAWWPESRYFVVPSMKTLSDLCASLESDDAWLVAAGLIEPLSILLVGEICRTIEPGTLLGDATWRGIGSGFDGGDLRDIGVVTRDGFVSPALIQSAPTPAPKKRAASKASKARASKARASKAKVAKARASKAKGSKATTSKAKGSSLKNAAKKKPVIKKAAGKKTTNKPSARKKPRTGKAPGSKKATRKASKKKPARRGR